MQVCHKGLLLFIAFLNHTIKFLYAFLIIFLSFIFDVCGILYDFITLMIGLLWLKISGASLKEGGYCFCIQVQLLIGKGL